MSSQDVSSKSNNINSMNIQNSLIYCIGGIFFIFIVYSGLRSFGFFNKIKKDKKPKGNDVSQKDKKPKGNDVSQKDKDSKAPGLDTTKPSQGDKEALERENNKKQEKDRVEREEKEKKEKEKVEREEKEKKEKEREEREEKEKKEKERVKKERVERLEKEKKEKEEKERVEREKKEKEEKGKKEKVEREENERIEREKKVEETRERMDRREKDSKRKEERRKKVELEQEKAENETCQNILLHLSRDAGGSEIQVMRAISNQFENDQKERKSILDKLLNEKESPNLFDSELLVAYTVKLEDCENRLLRALIDQNEGPTLMYNELDRFFNAMSTFPNELTWPKSWLDKMRQSSGSSLPSGNMDNPPMAVSTDDDSRKKTVDRDYLDIIAIHATKAANEGFLSSYPENTKNMMSRVVRSIYVNPSLFGCTCPITCKNYIMAVRARCITLRLRLYKRYLTKRYDN